MYLQTPESLSFELKGLEQLAYFLVGLKRGIVA